MRTIIQAIDSCTIHKKYAIEMQGTKRVFKMLLVFIGLLIAGQVFSQEWKLSPLQQRTIMTYAGKDAKPVTPVAMLNSKQANGRLAAEQLAAQRSEALHVYSLHPKGENPLKMDTDSIRAVFQKAAEDKAVLYFEEADAQFHTLEPAGEEKALRDLFFSESKKFGGAVLWQCLSQNTWYALAKAGCGIVSLD